jgi:hypothetical protein
MYEQLKELPESKEEVTIPILIRGDFCSENCPFLYINYDNYDECNLFETQILNHYKGADCNCLYVRCDSCKQKVPTKQ